MENKNNEKEKLDFRLLISSLTIILLFFFFRLFSYQFQNYVKFFWVKHNISYNLLEFIKEIFLSVVLIIIIFLTGYNPLRWSKEKIILLRNSYQDLFKKRFVQALVVFVIVLIIRFFLTISDFNFNLKLMYEKNRNNYTLSFFIARFLNAFWEELLFKGLLYRSLLKVKNLTYMKYIWMIVTSVIFAFTHIFAYGFDLGLYPYIGAFISSIFSFLVFNIYPSIWLVSLYHTLRNILVLQVIFS